MARTIDYSVVVPGELKKVPWKTVAAVTGACVSIGAIAWVASR